MIGGRQNGLYSVGTPARELQPTLAAYYRPVAERLSHARVQIAQCADAFLLDVGVGVFGERFEVWHRIGTAAGAEYAGEADLLVFGCVAALDVWVERRTDRRVAGQFDEIGLRHIVVASRIELRDQVIKWGLLVGIAISEIDERKRLGQLRFGFRLADIGCVDL